MEHTIFLTLLDYERLKQMTASGDIRDKASWDNFYHLSKEIERAKKVKSQKISPDVVTMNTVIEFVDIQTGVSRQLKLVYPHEADMKKGYVSVLAPIGTALLGYKKGDIIEWDVPSGKKKFLIKEIIYQPEAHGEYMV
jgi:regulator of nucleoside diphosphate kinase